MATKIKETPILSVKEAKNFLSEINNSKKISLEEKQKIRESYEKLKSISNF